MKEIITFTPNPALDVTYQVHQIRIGQTHRVHQVFRRAGGKGLNTASVLAQMGFPARAVGFFTSAEFIDDLNLRGEEFRDLFTFTPLRCPFPNRSSISITAQGQSTVFNEARPDYGLLSPVQVAKAWQDSWDGVLKMDWVRGGSIVTINGSFAPETPSGVLSNLIAGLHSKHCWVLVDTSGDYLLEAAEAGADCLKPNVEELLNATGTSKVSVGAAKLFSLGAKSLLVSAGSEGLAYIVSDTNTPEILRAHWAVPGEILNGNPTGAGDAAVAGFVSGIAADLPLTDLLTRAVSWSAGAVVAPVAGVVESDVVEQFATAVTHRNEEWSINVS